MIIYRLADGLIVEQCLSGSDISRYSPESFGVIDINISEALGKVYKNGEILESEIDIGAAKISALQQIDAQAEEIRGKYLTLGAGQAMTYAAKETEAKNILDDIAPEPKNYPFLSAELGVTPHPVTGEVATSLMEMADIVLASAEMWRQMGANIEKIRRTAKFNVEKAVTYSEICDIITKIRWE